MADKTVSASEFTRNFARYRDDAATGDIVKVTNHGRAIGGFLSARHLEEYKQLKKYQQESLVVGSLPEDAVNDIESANYNRTP